MPNITGTAPYYYGRAGVKATGAFSKMGTSGSGTNTVPSGNLLASGVTPTFDASESNSIYSGNKVTPLSLATGFYIKYQ